MSWFFAAVYDRLTRPTEEACFQAWRADLLAGVTGDVLEIGAGTGHNLGHYGSAVSRLVLTEPDAAMRRRLDHQLAEVRSTGRLAGASIEISQAPAEHLPWDDATFDAVVSTLVLCSVSDQSVALAEIRRVLRPGGRLVYLEHVAAEDRPARLAWQRRAEPVWKRLAAGCHLTRTTATAIEQAGFRMEEVTPESARKASPLIRPTVRGVAVRPMADQPSS